MTDLLAAATEAGKSATIKQRLLEDIRGQEGAALGGAAEIEGLGKRHGLNGHDLAKNLDQLRKEGLITVGWKGDVMVHVRLKDHWRKRKPALTVAERVRQWLLDNQRIAQRDGWIYATPAQIRHTLGEASGNGNAVSVAIADMQSAGKLETRKEGYRIIAMRLLPAPEQEKITSGLLAQRRETAEREAAAAPPAAPEPAIWPAPELPATPLLDKYAAAREIALRVSAGNPYISISFEAIPIADEALELREALANLIGFNR